MQALEHPDALGNGCAPELARAKRGEAAAVKGTATATGTGTAGEALDVPGPLMLDSPLLMLEAARAGLGLAQIAEWYVVEDLASGRLRRVLDGWAAPLLRAEDQAAFFATSVRMS